MRLPSKPPEAPTVTTRGFGGTLYGAAPMAKRMVALYRKRWDEPSWERAGVGLLQVAYGRPRITHHSTIPDLEVQALTDKLRFGPVVGTVVNFLQTDLEGRPVGSTPKPRPTKQPKPRKPRPSKAKSPACASAGRSLQSCRRGFGS